MVRKSVKKIWWLLGLILAAALLFAGCEDPISALTGGSSDSGEVVELADNTELTGDEVITAAQFRSIQEKDRTVTFTGHTDSGVEYVWTFNGKNIQNPQDQNLKVTLTDEGVTEAKAAANNAPYGLGIKLDNKGMITVPQLTLKLNEKWDADAAVYLKMDNGQVAKVSNVTFDPDQTDKTVVTVNVTQAEGTYYLVAGKSSSGNAGGNVADNTTGGSDTASGQGDTASGNTCTISINCSTLLSNLDTMEQSKREFVPADGWILQPTTVEFTEGESVHDILQRVCKENGIQMESSFTPAYNSAYVEGINQLYEFDGGKLSGWMYNVNGWFPNYGCSKYTVKSGDVINWVYTCDLGRDVGDNSMW